MGKEVCVCVCVGGEGGNWGRLVGCVLSLLDVRLVPINARFGTLAQKGLKVKLIFIRTEKNPFRIKRLYWETAVGFADILQEFCR